MSRITETLRAIATEAERFPTDFERQRGGGWMIELLREAADNIERLERAIDERDAQTAA